MGRSALDVQLYWNVDSLLHGDCVDLCFVCITFSRQRNFADKSSRNAAVESDGQCRIGLKLQANVPLMIFDIVINVGNGM